MFLIDSAGGFYWVLLAGACLAAFAVSSARRYLQRTFGQYGGVPADCGLTGALAARRLLAAVGLTGVAVERSNWVDCYDPRKCQVQLRDHTFDGSSLAALAIAAHEVGHAEQFARGFWPARLRLWMRPIYIGLLLTMLGVLTLGFVFLLMHWATLVVLGASFVMLLVQFPTVLPLEYDASRRAKALVVKEGLLAPYEVSSFDRLLNAASRTYLAWECKRWLVLLAACAVLCRFTPTWEPGPIDFAQISHAVVAEPAEEERAAAEEQHPLNTDVMYLLLPNLVILIPAVLLMFVMGKFTNASAKRPKTMETAVSRNNAGIGLLRRGEVAEALHAFSSALTLNPKLQAARFNRGYCHLRQGQFEQAIADVEESLRLNPHYVDALALRGQIWTHRARYDLAIADLNRALEMAPRNTTALACRGNLFLAQGNYDQALADFELAIGYAPEDGPAHLGRATIALARGNMDAALADCSQALAFGADAGAAYSMRGQIWLQKGEHDRAIADFTAALKNGQGSSMQFCNRGLAYYFKGIHNLAIADQDKAIDLDPLHAVAYNNRGAAYLKLGNYAAAIADLQRAIDLKPEFPNPHKHLAWLKATCPRPEFLDGAGALAHTQRAEPLARENPAEYQALLAVAHAAAGDFGSAVACQSRCLELSSPQELARMRARLTLYESHQPFRDALDQ